jgi:2',3'-cyclic-nucleotide 2'-phosphodiesterase (5'-nucleotidase family)
MLPFPDRLQVLKLNGALIRKALENAVSKYPVFDGRFPMVSGLRLAFDPSRPAGDRVTKLTNLKGEEIIGTQEYTLATQAYAATGHDGFSCFTDPGCKATHH